MPLLLYCVTEASVTDAAAPTDSLGTGVGGAKIEELQEAKLRCFFSRLDSREQLARLPAVEAAVGFHGVLKTLFRQGSIIPFRFPTVLESEHELKQELREKVLQYAGGLERLRNKAQMEIRIALPLEAAGQAASGTEYLRERQGRAAKLAAAAAQFRQGTQSWVAEWREHRTGEGMRCYALVERQAVDDFRAAAHSLAGAVPGARVSGPWPPTEFFTLSRGR